VRLSRIPRISVAVVARSVAPAAQATRKLASPALTVALSTEPGTNGEVPNEKLVTPGRELIQAASISSLGVPLAVEIAGQAARVSEPSAAIRAAPGPNPKGKDSETGVPVGSETNLPRGSSTTGPPVQNKRQR